MKTSTKINRLIVFVGSVKKNNVFHSNLPIWLNEFVAANNIENAYMKDICKNHAC